MEKTPSLFDLTSDFLTLIDMGYPEITDKDSEEVIEEKKADIETFDSTLNMILECIGDKANDYSRAITIVEGKAKILKAEIDKLTAMKKALDNAKKRMRERMTDTLKAMRDSGVAPVIRTDLHTFSLQKVGGKLTMTITGDVPDNFKRVVYENDNDKIRAALEAGQTLPFAHLEPRAETVRIR